jgi:hypothetical protein
VKLLVAAPVAMALHACDGEKDQTRTAIADKRDPWRSARENGGGEEGRTAAAVAREKARVFSSVERRARMVAREKARFFLFCRGGRTKVFK